MQNFSIALLDSLFPLNCSFCGRYDLFSSKLSLCKRCIKEQERKENLVFVDSSCDVCGSILILEECEYCSSRNIFFSSLLYIRIKGDLERKIIQKIKFGNAPYLGNYFRLSLKKLMPKLKYRAYTGIVNIPSNRASIRQRPLPVCKSVTDFLQAKMQLKALNLFHKKSKELQSGKSFRDRFLHAQTAFEINTRSKNSLTGNYLLVDDIFTTGATINEIAKMLLINGAERVDVLVLVKGKM